MLGVIIKESAMTQFKPSGRKIAVIATNGLEQSGLTWREADQGLDQQELGRHGDGGHGAGRCAVREP
jgi:hypothetical protein